MFNMQGARETKLNRGDSRVESYIQSHFIPGARFQNHLNDPRNPKFENQRFTKRKNQEEHGPDVM